MFSSFRESDQSIGLLSSCDKCYVATQFGCRNTSPERIPVTPLYGALSRPLTNFARYTLLRYVSPVES